jgi:cytochrome b pre-mRNA-processing protein 3
MLNVIIVAIVCAALVSGLRYARTRTKVGRTAARIYEQVVEAARLPALFQTDGAPDTMEGRFGVLVLHLFPVLERLARAGTEGEALARATFEAFVTDIDDNMREVGLADTTVPRKVKRAAIAYYDRRSEYRAALLAGDTTLLARSIGEHVAGDPTARCGPTLARRLSSVLAALDKADDGMVREGRLGALMMPAELEGATA